MVMRAEMQSVAERKAAYSADCAKPGTKEFENRRLTIASIAD